MAVTLKTARTEWPEGFGKPSVVVPAGTALLVGKVLGVKVDRSVRIMSDVWADCFSAEFWDDATGTLKSMGLGNTEFGMDATAVADAPAADYEKAFAFLVASHEAKLLADRDARVWTAVAAAHRVTKGREVVVVKGRKVPKGTTGEVFWTGESTWGPRVGFKDAAGTVHWTAMGNVEVTDAWDHFDFDLWDLTPDKAAGIKAEALKLALRDAADRGWVGMAAAAAALDALPVAA